MRAAGGAGVGVVLVVARLRLGFARVALARELVREVQRELAVAVHEVEPGAALHQEAVSADAGAGAGAVASCSRVQEHVNRLANDYIPTPTLTLLVERIANAEASECYCYSSVFYTSTVGVRTNSYSH